MPVTYSTMVPLGAQMPAFSLPDVSSGKTVSSTELDPAKPVLVLFICAHCPFSKHIAPAIRRLARDYGERVNLLALSGNDIAQVPEDSPEGLKRLAQAFGFSAPFLYDQSQTTVRAFGAECTPECFLYDTDRKLVYRGEIDESRPGGRGEPMALPVRAALDAILSGADVSPNQKPGVGCNIKWRAATPAGATR